MKRSTFFSALPALLLAPLGKLFGKSAKRDVVLGLSRDDRLTIFDFNHTLPSGVEVNMAYSINGNVSLDQVAELFPDLDFSKLRPRSQRLCTTYDPTGTFQAYTAR